MTETLREIEIKNGYPFSGSRGYFHGWCREPSLMEPSITKTFALIEFSDGNVSLIDPITMKFIEPYSTKEKGNN